MMIENEGTGDTRLYYVRCGMLLLSYEHADTRCEGGNLGGGIVSARGLRQLGLVLGIIRHRLKQIVLLLDYISRPFTLILRSLNSTLIDLYERWEVNEHYTTEYTFFISPSASISTRS